MASVLNAGARLRAAVPPLVQEFLPKALGPLRWAAAHQVSLLRKNRQVVTKVQPGDSQFEVVRGRGTHLGTLALHTNTGHWEFVPPPTPEDLQLLDSLPNDWAPDDPALKGLLSL